MTPNDVLTADEVFFSGTAVEVTPIREVDNTVIGNGRRGPITEKIHSTFFDVVHGKIDRYKDWLAYVPAAKTAVV